MALTDHQAEVFNNISGDIMKGLLGNNDYSIITLSGYAGTGKTYLLSELIKFFNGKYKQTVTAPTHQAVKVITDTLFDNGCPTIDSRTIHSYLKLKLEDDHETGKKKLTQNLFNPDKNHADIIDILYTDESSMVSDELLGYAVQKIKSKELKVIVLVGDQFQLLPVDDTEVSTLIKDEVEHELKFPVRQAEGSPILTTSWVIKDRIIDKQYPRIDTLFDKLTVTKSRKEFMTRYFDDDNTKMIGSFTNKMSQRYNNYVRKLTKDSPEECFIPGDELCFYDTFYKGEQLIHLNSEVTEIESCVKMYDDKHNVSYWNVIDTDFNAFPVLDFDDQPKFQRSLQVLADKANGTKNPQLRRSTWAQYFALKNKYANVRYNFSSTLHRLQGSTVDSIYCDFTDLENRNVYGEYMYDRDTVFRLMYVAITRARTNVVILL